jgi:hypothetical protein
MRFYYLHQTRMSMMIQIRSLPQDLHLSPTPAQKFKLIHLKLCVCLWVQASWVCGSICTWARSCPLLHAWRLRLMAPDLLQQLFLLQARQWRGPYLLDRLRCNLLDLLCSGKLHPLLRLHALAQGSSMGSTSPRPTLIEQCGMGSSQVQLSHIVSMKRWVMIDGGLL